MSIDSRCSLSVGVRFLFFMNTVAAKYAQPVHLKVLNLLYVRRLQRIMEAPWRFPFLVSLLVASSLGVMVSCLNHA